MKRAIVDWKELWNRHKWALTHRDVNRTKDMVSDESRVCLVSDKPSKKKGIGIHPGMHEMNCEAWL